MGFLLVYIIYSPTLLSSFNIVTMHYFNVMERPIDRQFVVSTLNRLWLSSVLHKPRDGKDDNSGYNVSMETPSSSWEAFNLFPLSDFQVSSESGQRSDVGRFYISWSMASG